MPTYCFEILKLSIETDTIDRAECEKLINENQDVVTEKYNGKTLLNHTCLRLNQLLPSEDLCKSVRYGIFYEKNKFILENHIKRLNELRIITTQLLLAGAIPTDQDTMFFQSVLRRFTDQTAFESSLFTKILKDFRELTQEFIKHGFDFTIPNEFPFNPVTSRMKAEELYAYIQFVMHDSTQTINEQSQSATL